MTRAAAPSSLLVSLVVSLVLAPACGPRVTTTAAPTLALPDAAAALAARLPSGADACVVARHGAVADRRRSLVRGLSSGRDLAWSNGPFRAYAEARQGGHGRVGRVASRVLLRVEDLALARRWLTEVAPIQVRWLEHDPCRDGELACRTPHARLLDERTLLVAQGEWYGVDAEGEENRCAALALEHRDAIEVASMTTWVGGVNEDGERRPIPAPYQSVLRPTRTGLAQEALLALGAGGSVLEVEHLVHELVTRNASAASDSQVRATPRGVEVRVRYQWEDLRLQADDDRRVRRAMLLDQRGPPILPLDEVEIAHRDRVRAQVALREDQLEATREGSLRDARRSELMELLERAVRVHTRDTNLATRLYDLWLEAGRAQDAAELAGTLRTRFPSRARHWSVARRRAFAAVGAEPLATALVEDEIVARRDASRAAEALVPLAGDYEWAEGAWLAAQSARRLRLPMRPASARLPATSTVESLVTLLLDDAAPRRAVFAVLQGRATGAAGVFGGADARIVTFGERGATVSVGAAVTDQNLRALGRTLATLIEETEVDLLLMVRGFGDASGPPDAALQVRVRREGDQIVVRRASTVRREGRALRWDRLGPLLGVPFAHLTPRMFPPPELRVTLPTIEDAARAETRSEEESVLQCASFDEQLECSASPELDVTRRAWRRLMTPWLFP